MANLPTENDEVLSVSNYRKEKLLLWSSWVAASVFAAAGLATLFFGYEGFCHITNCNFIEVYPLAEGMSNSKYQEVVSEAFDGIGYAPLVMAGIYFVIWLALGYVVFSYGVRLLNLVGALHLLVVIYAFLAYSLIGNKVAVRDTNVWLIFLVPPLVGGFASVSYFFLRDSFRREQENLKNRVGSIRKNVRYMADSLSVIHLVNNRLQERSNIKLNINSGETSRTAIDQLNQTFDGAELTPEITGIANTLHESQRAVDRLSPYPGRVQQLPKEHRSKNKLLANLKELDTWVLDAKKTIANDSTRLAEELQVKGAEILDSHQEIPLDDLLREFLKPELYLRLDRRIRSIESTEFPWSDARNYSPEN